MALKKGDKLNPNGRPKGTPNRNTSDLRARINDIVSNRIDTIDAELDKLKPLERLQIITGLLKYTIAPLQSLDPTTQIQLEYIALEKLLNNCPEEFLIQITNKIDMLKGQSTLSENTPLFVVDERARILFANNESDVEL